MSYPGNTSLSQDIRERIQSTYRQTLELAAQGNRQEASLGCDFILRLDAEFEPAQRLLSRLEATGEGPVDVDDLRPGTPGYDGAARAPDAPAAPSAAAGAGGDALSSELDGLFREHRYAELLERAAEERERVIASPELAQRVQTAQERLEAEPYVKSFLDQARQALRQGDSEQAGRLLDSARQLDPDHPDLADLQALIATRSGAVPAPPAATTLAPPADDDDLPSFDELPDLSLAEPPPAAAPAGAEPREEPLAGFSLTGEPATSAEDERIQALLQEGEQAFGRKEYQEAIDAWSRIFLIDIDHQGAARRIEQARRLKDEREREVEEAFHDAATKLEAGDAAAARPLFERVLALQPGHLAAREYLQEIEEGRTATAGAGAAKGAGALSVPDPSELDDERPLAHEILVPPEPGAERAPAETASAPTQAAAASPLPSRRFLAIGSAVLVLVLAAGWFLFDQRDRFFPNASEDAVAPGGAGDPIEQATRLHEAGRRDQALAHLQRIPQGNPHYEEAQALLSQWQAETQPGTAVASTTPNVDRTAQIRQDLLERAGAAIGSGENLLAVQLYDEAAAIAPLGAADQERHQRAQSALAPIEKYVALVRGGDWEFALRDLWRLREADPGNRDVARLLVQSYYNLGVRDLQRGDVQAAEESFEEAAKLAPGDEMVGRNLDFSRTYQQRRRDLLYDIYTRKLEFR